MSTKTTNLGSRIQLLLDRLEWQHADLIERVPGLTATTLTRIVQRDSKSSKFAPAIAQALGIDIRWLLTGEGSAGGDEATLPATGAWKERWVQLGARLSETQRMSIEIAISLLLGANECDNDNAKLPTWQAKRNLRRLLHQTANLTGPKKTKGNNL